MPPFLRMILRDPRSIPSRAFDLKCFQPPIHRAAGLTSYWKRTTVDIPSSQHTSIVFAAAISYARNCIRKATAGVWSVVLLRWRVCAKCGGLIHAFSLYLVYAGQTVHVLNP